MAGPQLFAKTPHDRMKWSWSGTLEVPTGALQPVDCTQQVLRRADDGFRGEILAVIQFLGGDGEEKPKMFARREDRIAFVAQKITQRGWGDELYTEVGMALLQQPLLQGVRMGARRHDHDGGQRSLP